MKTYSRKQVALYCAATALLTVAAIAAFRFTLWPRVRHELGLNLDASVFGQVPDARPAVRLSDLPVALDMVDPEARNEVRKRYERMVTQRASMLSVEEQEEILWLFASLDVWKNMYWLGIPVLKSPGDMWMMQQVIAEIQPDYIIEAGTWRGGSALYLAHILEGLGLPDAKVITIDIQDLTAEASKHPLWQKRVEFIHGSSTDPEVVSRITEQVRGKKVIVDLDSNHARNHVLNELKAYSPLVSPGSYIIVEDTGLDGIPLMPELGLGPMAAAKEFLESDAGATFAPDFTREAFLLTLHPGGWLRRAQ